MRRYTLGVDLPENAPSSLYDRLEKKYGQKKVAHDVWGVEQGMPVRKADEPSLTFLQDDAAPGHEEEHFDTPIHELDMSMFIMDPHSLLGTQASVSVAGVDVMGKVASIQDGMATLSLEDGSTFDTEVQFLRVAQLSHKQKYLEKSNNPRIQELLRRQKQIQQLQEQNTKNNLSLLDRGINKPQAPAGLQVKPQPPPVVAPEPAVPMATNAPEQAPIVPAGSQPTVSGSKKAQAVRPVPQEQELAEPPPGAPVEEPQAPAQPPKEQWQVNREETQADWSKIAPLLKQPGGASIWLTPGKIGATIRPKGSGFTVTLMELRTVPIGKAQYMDAPQILEMLSSNPQWKPLETRGAMGKRMARLLSSYADLD